MASLGRILAGLGAWLHEWERTPACEWCERRCRGECPAARRISDLEWELEVARAKEPSDFS